MVMPFDTFSLRRCSERDGRSGGEPAPTQGRDGEGGFTNYDQEWLHYSFDVPNPLKVDRVIL